MNFVLKMQSRKAARAIANGDAPGAELLEMVRDAIATGQDTASALAIVDDFVAKHPPQQQRSTRDRWTR